MKNNEMSSEDVAQFWDGNADRWATDVRAGWDAYREYYNEYYNNPAFLEFVGDLSSGTVLDAGCGEGLQYSALRPEQHETLIQSADVVSQSFSISARVPR